MVRLFSTLLAFGLVLILSTTVPTLGYAQLGMGTGLTVTGALGKNTPTGLSQSNVEAAFNYRFGDSATWRLSICAEQELAAPWSDKDENPVPTSLLFGWIIRGKSERNPQLRVAVGPTVSWLEDGSYMGIKAEIGCQIPTPDSPGQYFDVGVGGRYLDKTNYQGLFFWRYAFDY